MTVGERIKERRLELGLSQEELAIKCGYKSRSSINKIELARDLPLKKIEQMASALDVTPSYLMGWEEPEELVVEIKTKDESYIVDIMREMDDKHRDMLLSYAEYLIREKGI